jgi:small subunit ribosomal protein S1
VLDSFSEGDDDEGKVTKVVTFGAFVEIMPGVEGLVHISELAQHHVENPREVVSQGDQVEAKIIEVDAERRRLSLSLKRIEDADEVQPRADGQPLETPEPPRLDLSEDVFPETDEAPAEGSESASAAESAAEDVAPAPEEPVAESTPDIPAAEPEVPAEATDASLEADAVAPEEQGPGDSEGEPPAAPDEPEEQPT